MQNLFSKNIILFGAGASFGSEPSKMPPLGAQLFDELVREYPDHWGSIFTKYCTVFKENFELGMERLLDEIPQLVPELHRKMALYLSSFSPSQFSLYLRFAQRFQQNPKQLTIATLNYDMLLPLALKKVNLNLSLFLKSPDSIELILPHGSCNLMCSSVYAKSDQVKFAANSVSVNSDVGQIHFLTDPDQVRSRITDNAIPPIMSYFEKNKNSTAGQTYLLQSRLRLAELIENAVRIIIIGVKIREHDEHIWNPIKNAHRKLIYCSGLAEIGEFESFVSNNRSSRENKFLNGFWSEKFDEVFNELV